VIGDKVVIAAPRAEPNAENATLEELRVAMGGCAQSAQLYSPDGERSKPCRASNSRVMVAEYWQPRSEESSSA
jgi:hypothetical protein